jgi:dTDP-4-dehydro-6-deoxy-alpha-D-glucopyranose 2,3-dehydratase
VTLLKARTESELPVRLARSAAATEGVWIRTEDVPAWLAARGRTHCAEVRRIPFAKLDGWSFGADTGDLAHRSGRFFSIAGLHVVREGTTCPEWRQPIIVQPEIGILGIVVKEFGGVPHFLMQAKMEPGNPNLVQLSPTVQATRSNYTQVHGGARVKYLNYFTEPVPGPGNVNGDGRRRVIADVLQSEHGAWFYQKRNRNMIIEVTGNVPPDEDFCWLTLGQLGALLRMDNIVNMDARTVLACAPVAHHEAGALSPDADVLSWFTGERARHDVRARRIPLAEVTAWVRGDRSIHHMDGRFFQIVAVSVAGANREVSGWTQPLLEPVGQGIAGFAFRRFGGVPHLLVHARVEGGFLDTAELGPTAQYVPTNYVHLSGARRPAFLDLMLRADPARIRYEAKHSEEGGRFLNAVSRYLIVETDEATTPAEPPPGYQWLTPGQLNSLAAHSRYVNVQARTLLAVLTTQAADLS